jgi:hypothetical protein
VIKIEWKVIQDLYNDSKSQDTKLQEHSKIEINKIKSAILELRHRIKQDYWKSIIVIWEWIDSFDMWMFAKNSIGADYWQGRDLKQSDFQINN